MRQCAKVESTLLKRGSVEEVWQAVDPVIIGATELGKKEFIAIEDGYPR